MHASIRRYEGVAEGHEELAQAVRRLASGLSQAPGFLSFVAVEAGSGVLAIVSLFEDRASLEEAERVAEALIAERMAALLPGPALVTAGEIIFQRGL
jgi:heme-degrading monooxygenase HmoA